MHSAQLSVIFDYLVVFIYTGKPDSTIHLNIESKKQFVNKKQ